MSSKKWLAQQGFFSPMKKIASSQQLSMSIEDSNSSSSSDEDEDRFRNRKAQQQKMFHIWTPIDQDDQIHHQKKKEIAEGQFDIWSSLVKDGAKNEENKSVVPEAPYVHPLVKKQSNSLKGKSLEVCTESLGSETGSEGFASYPSSETGDIVVDRKEEEQVAENQQQQQQQQDQEKQVNTQAVAHVEEFRVVKYNAAAAAVAPANKSAAVARSFPPPIPSLSGSDGASLRIKTHRDNGRFTFSLLSPDLLLPSLFSGSVLLRPATLTVSPPRGRHEAAELLLSCRKVGDFGLVFEFGLVFRGFFQPIPAELVETSSIKVVHLALSFNFAIVNFLKFRSSGWR
ncbi:hypothetical protein ACLB2K_029352 [Fragaria x ananassa]